MEKWHIAPESDGPWAKKADQGRISVGRSTLNPHTLLTSINDGGDGDKVSERANSYLLRKVRDGGGGKHYPSNPPQQVVPQATSFD
jgi:hypothetical protein